MRNTFIPIIVLIFSSRYVVATFGWLDSPAYSSPSNTNNECIKEQKNGFDWSDLEVGPFSVYTHFSFLGFSKSDSFSFSITDKTDVSKDQIFQKNCITSLASSDKLVAPRFGVESSKEISAFSITKIFVSVEFDCDLEFHYIMRDGSTCMQKSFCSSSGSVVQNDQCGGATSVAVLYPSQTTGVGKYRNSCHFGFHSIGFDCNPASSATRIATSTTEALVTATSVFDAKKTSTGSTETQTIISDVTSYYPSSSTEIQISSATVMPTPDKTTLFTSTVTSSRPMTTAPCPDILPACLNTWLFMVGCNSNADVACFCPSVSFSKYVYSCLVAHAKSEEEALTAQKYYQGICVNYISINPEIITGSLPIVPPTNNSSINAGSTSIEKSLYVPVTVIEILTTLTLPSVGPVNYPTKTGSVVLSTSLTVPEVAFTTVPLKSGLYSDVGLVPCTTRANETKINLSSSTSPVSIPTNISTSDASKDIAALCVVGAALIFAAAIIL